MPRKDAVGKLASRLGREVCASIRRQPKDMEAAATIIVKNLTDFLFHGCEVGRGVDELGQEWPSLVKRCVAEIQAIDKMPALEVHRGRAD